MILNFVKEEDNRWYIDLPNWEGDKVDLEMVMGSDTLLEYISNNGDCVSIKISLDEPSLNRLEFVRLTDEIGEGAIYNAVYNHFTSEIWLCDVTKFVFGGEFPEKIFIK